MTGVSQVSSDIASTVSYSGDSSLPRSLVRRNDWDYHSAHKIHNQPPTQHLTCKIAVIVRCLDIVVCTFWMVTWSNLSTRLLSPSIGNILDYKTFTYRTWPWDYNIIYQILNNSDKKTLSSVPSSVVEWKENKDPDPALTIDHFHKRLGS